MKQIAIKVENKRQFDALMTHYDEKGWKNFNECLPNELMGKWNIPAIIQYHDRFGAYKENQISHTVIDFDTFSQLTGVKVVNEIAVKLLNNSVANVFEHHIEFNGSPVDRLEALELEKIYTAYKSLQ